ncbi:MAG: sigma 54-dependent Fis family transcriptional regulator [Myxococcaceae bacterium]|nr:sigma 54-dependent Fis family transcriptional regulator [Myxococcaceae bacterium]
MSEWVAKPTEPLSAPTAEHGELVVVVVSGPDAGRELELSPGTHQVGTQPGCALTLTDTSVSRVHLFFEANRGHVVVHDQKSRNGSFCRGIRFERADARAGMLIRIGRTELLLVPSQLRRSGVGLSTSSRFGSLVGSSIAMRHAFALLERAAPTDIPILVTGETGTGKEGCARAIHDASTRARAPFVVCDLGCVSPTLFESELFGHERGAFTGAVSSRPGVFERAHGGTLFLDELGAVPLELQPRLLRAVESREVKRLGSNKPVEVDVRIVAATHLSLEDEMAAKRFRPDLYHRFAVVKVELPALRDRLEDLPALCDAILTTMGKGRSALPGDALSLLAGYAWPGNVRELRNVLERAVNVGPETLYERFAEARAAAAERGPFKEARQRVVDAFERDYLVDLMKRYSDNVTHAAKAAGIDRVSLYRLLKKHALSTVDAPE